MPPFADTLLADAPLADMLVDEVMRRWPATIPVFIRHRLRCVGCPIALFHTVAEACTEHDVRLLVFLADIETAIGDKGAASAAGEGRSRR
ncbi:DUF1858 domain-containing protein [Chelatococcus sp. SYSU_G07232]|uniref:DUF1858 domain-containing protein n=1 Tax=Chelatococcus albus TaxID=3047466 RepID=A0ABT7AFS3_9HYPH|nr:DUF1858 domain-containing protein [Chelatococcus sp. SYSU_G07232]MDJ1158210.1 DUF1858 domain-containing protein [Chelatococcus sp. SYSU_G07232]